ncbi:MAG: hypothetical protein ACK5MA_03135, partial [Parachlamydiaceae bacterium]
GNRLVRIGLFTPKAKRETLKSAENLIETAKAAVSVLNQVIYGLEISDEEFLKLEGDDPNYILSLLEKAGKHGVYKSQRDRLENIATHQCIELFELMNRRERNLVFEKGHWVIKPMEPIEHRQERNQRLNDQLLRYAPHINYRTFRENAPHSQVEILFLNRVETPFDLLKCLGGGFVRQHHIEGNFPPKPNEWIPAVIKYLRDTELVENTSLIHILEHLGSADDARNLTATVQRVIRSGWNSPMEDLSELYFSGLLDNREFRNSAEIFGQLKRGHLPDGADFDQRVKQFALKTQNDAEAANKLHTDLTAVK